MRTGRHATAAAAPAAGADPEVVDAAGALVPQEQWYSNLAQTGNIGTASVFALLQGFLASDDAAPGTRILVHVPESGRGLNALMLMEICHS